MNTKIELVPLTRDFMFKRVFGINQDLLKKFLISVLHLDFNPNNTDIIMESNELIKSKKREYHKTVDILVSLNNLITIDVELNSSKQEDVSLRNFLYLNKIITNNVESGNDIKIYEKYFFYQLNLNVHKFKDNIGEKIYSIKEETSNEEYVSNFKIVSKSLDYYYNFYYTNNRNVNEDIVWLALLSCKTFDELEEMSDLIMSNKEKERFINTCRDASQDKLILSEWEADKMADLVKLKTIENAKKEGIDEGVEQNNRTNIINMLKKKLDVELISEITGKNIEYIKEIEKEIK